MRQVEKVELTGIEQELAFAKYCKKEGVEIVLADGDDSLWMMSNVFRKKMGLAYLYLEEVTGRDRREWAKIVAEVNDRLYESMGVNPIRWEAAMAEVARVKSLGREEQLKATEMLMEIYRTVPEIIPGTIEGLELLNRCEVPVGIVTHANEEWTRWKFESLGLGRYLPWDRVSIINEDGHKTKEAWREACRYQGVSPRAVLLFGDSPRSDINPCVSIGVLPRHCCLIKNGLPVWQIQQQMVDDEVREVSSLGDVRWLGAEVIHRR